MLLPLMICVIFFHTKALNPLPVIWAHNPFKFQEAHNPCYIPSSIPLRRCSRVKDRYWCAGGSCWSRVYWVVNSSSHLMKAGQADKPCSSEFMKQVFPRLTRPGTSPEKVGGGRGKHITLDQLFLSLSFREPDFLLRGLEFEIPTSPSACPQTSGGQAFSPCRGLALVRLLREPVSDRRSPTPTPRHAARLQATTVSGTVG